MRSMIDFGAALPYRRLQRGRLSLGGPFLFDFEE
jgi:hypothetical protein